MTTRGVGIAIFSVLCVIGAVSLYYVYKGEPMSDVPVKETDKKKRRRSKSTVEARVKDIVENK